MGWLLGWSFGRLVGLSEGWLIFQWFLGVLGSWLAGWLVGLFGLVLVDHRPEFDSMPNSVSCIGNRVVLIKTIVTLERGCGSRTH